MRKTNTQKGRVWMIGIKSSRLKSRGRLLMQEMYRKRNYYVFILPAVAFYLVFSYFPMYFLQIAFRDYRVTRPLDASTTAISGVRLV